MFEPKLFHDEPNATGHRAPGANSHGEGVLSAGDAVDIVALASLDLFPRQLNELVFRFGARGAWQRVLAGQPGLRVPDEVARQWARRAQRTNPEALFASHLEAGVGVAVFGGSNYPLDLIDDPEAPLVLFSRGDLDECGAPRVGIVGTRRATGMGLEIAEEWGEALSCAGVTVVSGLAAGIDAAAHRGAMRGPTAPLGVVGSGLDVPYPRSNRGLWVDVAARGLMLSEYPLGTSPVAWHFPARNRLLAALSDVMVVVESHESGGSLITALAALERHRTVLAVPGPVRNSSSRGVNRLISDGAGVACDIEDVLVAVGLSGPFKRPRSDQRLAPTAIGLALLDAMGWAPARFDMLASRAQVTLMVAADELGQLVSHGWATSANGWFERVARDRSSATKPSVNGGTK